MCKKDREKPLKLINQIKTTQQESSNITQNNQHSQYHLKPPYNSMQATYLPQFNNHHKHTHREREREREKEYLKSNTKNSLALITQTCNASSFYNLPIRKEYIYIYITKL